MSHTVTVTRTTTSTTTSAIILNTGYCKTAPGLVKIGEVCSRSAHTALCHRYDESHHAVELGHHMSMLMHQCRTVKGFWNMLSTCALLSKPSTQSINSVTSSIIDLFF
ncbi:hypothetical protein J6590_105315 [Homalodisca vitripennis]|nr:hypothetical protein J6590_105315 [Homalodisca vitripennis]